MSTLYKLEKPGVEVIETPHGFITYKLDGKTMCILELYIRPEYRSQGRGLDLMNRVKEIARKAGATAYMTTIDPSEATAKPLRKIFNQLGLKRSDKNITVELELYTQRIS